MVACSYLAKPSGLVDRIDVKKPANVRVTFDELVAEGLKIQPRFLAEPLFAKTGTGFMRSTGVAEIAAAKRPKNRHPVRSRLRK